MQANGTLVAAKIHVSIATKPYSSLAYIDTAYNERRFLEINLYFRNNTIIMAKQLSFFLFLILSIPGYTQAPCPLPCEPLWNIATTYNKNLTCLTYDIDGDGDDEIINRSATSINQYVIHSIDIKTDFLREDIKTSDAYYIRSQPVIFDFDKDGQDDLVITDNTDVILLDLNSLKPKNCFENFGELTPGNDVYFFDINNDGNQEIITGSGFEVLVYDLDFDLIHRSDRQIYNLNFGNFDDDDHKEIIFANGEVYQYKDNLFEKEYDIPNADLSAFIHERIVADVNNDGKDEFLYLSESNALRCYDVAAESALYEIPVQNAEIFGLADFDHDGILDVAIYNQDTQSLNAYDGYTGQLKFTRTLPSSVKPDPRTNHKMVLGDFDGDNSIEFWDGSRFNDHFMYDLDNQQVDYILPNFPSVISNEFEFADLNADGKKELVTLSGTSIKIYDTTDKRLKKVFSSEDFPFYINEIEIFDYQSDGDVDIMVAGLYRKPFEPDAQQFIIVDGETGNIEWDTLLPFNRISDLVVKDINDDDVPDYLCTSGQNFYILDGRSLEVLVEAEDFNPLPWLPQYKNVQVENLDDDPALEFVLIDDVVVVVDDYSTGFSLINYFDPCCASSEDVTLADWDGDGKSEIIYQFGGKVMVLSALDLEIMEELQFYGLGSFNNMAYADIDGDGSDELIFSTDARIIIHHVDERTDIINVYGLNNNGEGVVRVLDYDLDGQLDLIWQWAEGIQVVDTDCIECSWIHENSIAINPSCYEDNGMIILQSNDPTAEFRYNDVIINDTIKDLGPGDYEFILSNKWGCAQSVNFSLEYENDFNFWEINRGSQDPGCNMENGMIWASTSLSGISYSLDGVIFQDTLRGLAEGNYKLTAYNDFGCFKEYDIELREPLSFKVDLQADLCGDPHYYAQISDIRSDQPYEIYWDGWLDNTISEPLEAGVHIVEVVTDSCTRTIEFEVPEFVLEDLLSLDIVILQNDCGQYYASIENLVYEVDIADNLNRDTLFLWDGIFLGLQSPVLHEPGIHNLFTWVDLCLYSWEFEIPEQPRPDYDLIISSSDCGINSHAQINNLQNPGNYEISWDGILTNETQSPTLINGSHVLQIIDAEGCQYIEQFSVTTSDLSVGLQIDNLDCSNSSTAQLSLLIDAATEPYQTAWSTGVMNVDSLTGISSGDYVVTVTDNAGCEEIVSITIPEANLMVTNDVQNNLCYGESNGSIELDISSTSNNYNIFWDDNSTDQIRENLENGSYSVSIYDTNGCRDSLSFEISSPDSLSVDAMIVGENSNTLDPDGSITIEVMGGSGEYEIFWSNGVSGLENLNLAADEYLLFIQDSNGCGLDTSFIVETIVSTQELSDLDVQFLPNPANDNFHILFPTSQKLEEIKLFESSGRMISSGFIDDMEEGRVLISVEELDAGVYIVHLEFAKGSITKKLIKQ